MSLAAAIHKIWKDTKLLTDEIPENRFFTGGPATEEDTAFPYAAVVFNSAVPEYESGDNYTEERLYRITVFDHIAENVVRIGEKVEQIFDNTDPQLTAPECFLAAYREDTRLERTELGQWSYTIDYRAIIERQFIG